MQDMDTLAPDDTNELKVVFLSTPNSHSLQVHSEDSLLSKGGSDPVLAEKYCNRSAQSIFSFLWLSLTDLDKILSFLRTWSRVQIFSAQTRDSYQFKMFLFF
jgi:hypothetical protein